VSCGKIAMFVWGVRGDDCAMSAECVLRPCLFVRSIIGSVAR